MIRIKIGPTRLGTETRSRFAILYRRHGLWQIWGA